MKKTLNVLLISILFAFAACGTSQEKLAKEKAIQDSILKAARNPQDFKAFLLTFISSLNEINNQNNFIHKDIGVYVYTNPGAFCVASKMNKMENMDKP